MISLAVPLALAALPLAALPLIIHWLTRGRVREQVFPPLALLQRIHAGRARRSQLREKIILLLRLLAIALAIFAMAGLAWRGDLGSANRPLVVVVDASASMQQVVGGASAFAQARGAATSLLDDAGSRAVGVIISGKPLRSSGDLAVGGGEALARLAEATVTTSDGAPAAALSEALRVLGPAGGDVVFVTDLARSSLAGIDPASLPEAVSLRLLDIGGGENNAGIIGLASEPGLVVAGRPATVAVRIANYASTPLKAAVDLRIGTQATVLPIELGPGESSWLRHPVVIDASGQHRIHASLVRSGQDALAADDARSGILEVHPGLTVLVVSGADSNELAGPVRPVHAALSAAGYTVRLTDGAGLAEELQATKPFLVASVAVRDAAGMAPPLRDWLIAGGRWLQFVATPADASLVLPGTDPPIALGQRMDVSTQERAAQPWAQARLEHPLFTVFAGREALLRSVAAYRYHLTPQQPAADAAVLATYADGTVAVAERPVGNGRWIMVNTSPGAADGTLAANEALPLLMGRLAAAMAPERSDGMTLEVGAIIAGAWKDENGRWAPAQNGRTTIPAPGLWQAADGSLVAAGLPGLESDLRQLDAARLGLEVRNAHGALTAVRTAPWWAFLLASVLGLLTVEILCAGGVGGRGPASATHKERS